MIHKDFELQGSEIKKLSLQHGNKTPTLFCNICKEETTHITSVEDRKFDGDKFKAHICASCTKCGNLKYYDN